MRTPWRVEQLECKVLLSIKDQQRGSLSGQPSKTSTIHSYHLIYSQIVHFVPSTMGCHTDLWLKCWDIDVFKAATNPNKPEPNGEKQLLLPSLKHGITECHMISILIKSLLLYRRTVWACVCVFGCGGSYREGVVRLHLSVHRSEQQKITCYSSRGDGENSVVVTQCYLHLWVFILQMRKKRSSEGQKYICRPTFFIHFENLSHSSTCIKAHRTFIGKYRN